MFNQRTVKTYSPVQTLPIISTLASVPMGTPRRSETVLRYRAGAMSSRLSIAHSVELTAPDAGMTETTLTCLQASTLMGLVFYKTCLTCLNFCHLSDVHEFANLLLRASTVRSFTLWEGPRETGVGEEGVTV
jgi:hypothetical protein